MSFATPWLLFSLLGLPVLWWLLRAVPPPPRRQRFPAIRLLAGLVSQDSSVHRTPWWLLLLRAAIATLMVMGFAGPVQRAVSPPPREGALMLVIDDGWASAPDWPARQRAALVAVDRALQAGGKISLLTTADDENANPPHPAPFMPANAARAMVQGLRPKPYDTDRAAAAKALAAAQPAAWCVYVADGLASPADTAFAQALRRNGPIEEDRADAANLQLLRSASNQGSALTANVALLPVAVPRQISLLAQTGTLDGLSHVVETAPPGATQIALSLTLPADLRNRLAQLSLMPVQAGGSALAPSPGPGAGSVLLLDDSAQLHPVGLLADGPAADLPFTGSLYYLRKALTPGAELHEGDLQTLLARKLSVIIDVSPQIHQADAAKLHAWMQSGGWLIRFAGFGIGPDEPLLPVALSAGNRQLGGALTWEQPAHLAPFPGTSPFAGLTAPPDVTVTRQIMAQPAPGLAAQSWANLSDGTPLVTWAAEGRGRLVLFHVTASPSWSSLPMSGVFPQMLRRLIGASSGVSGGAGAHPHGQDRLAPIETLNGFGILGSPPAASLPIAAEDVAATPVSPHHPPGFYGSADYRVAFNLGAHEGALALAPPIGAPQALDRIAADRDLTGVFLAAALALLLADWLISLRLRGIWVVLGLILLPIASHAAVPPAALQMRLAWVSSSDGADTQIYDGLKNLSAYMNLHTSVQLADPQPVTPGVDDLSFYPWLYFPIGPTTNLSAQAVAALNNYIGLGGLLVIDTGASGAAALQRQNGLAIPPLMQLTRDHVLTRTFYLIDSCGGASNGPVWVAQPADGGGDQVSPVVVGGNDWANAWAAGGGFVNSGTGAGFGYGMPLNFGAQTESGDQQTKLAFHCGVNLVMYALTGTYKADQLHVQTLLDKMGR